MLPCNHKKKSIKLILTSFFVISNLILVTSLARFLGGEQWSGCTPLNCDGLGVETRKD